MWQFYAETGLDIAQGAFLFGLILMSMMTLRNRWR